MCDSGGALPLHRVPLTNTRKNTSTGAVSGAFCTGQARPYWFLSFCGSPAWPMKVKIGYSAKITAASVPGAQTLHTARTHVPHIACS